MASLQGPGPVRWLWALLNDVTLRGGVCWGDIFAFLLFVFSTCVSEGLVQSFPGFSGTHLDGLGRAGPCCHVGGIIDVWVGFGVWFCGTFH